MIARVPLAPVADVLPVGPRGPTPNVDTTPIPVIAMRSANSTFAGRNYVDITRTVPVPIIAAVASGLAWAEAPFFVASLAYTSYFYAVLLGDP